MSPSQMLIVLLLGGLMGLLGQGSRAVVGLKSMSDDAKSLGVSSADLFQAARLVVSLVIGFLVGLAAALIYLSGNGLAANASIDWHTLLGFAASGYLGTDFLEAFISKYLAPMAAAGSTGPVAGPKAAPMAKGAPAPKGPPAPMPAPAPAPTTAKQLVYSVMNHLLPGIQITDGTQLATIGYDDFESKEVIRQSIDNQHWNRVDLPIGALANCSKISDITAVVTSAIPS